jgi:8-oxo-dGTP pyrophosphatase MutT (NUDIX family)
MNNPASEQQYGALAWRQANGVEVLLITSRQTKRWLIPKGWPIDGKSPAEGAAQEAFEEAGVRGMANSVSLGSFNYEKRFKGSVSQFCRVGVFALEVKEILEDWPEAHERERRWYPADEAAALVDEAQLAEIIRRFARDQSGGELQNPGHLREVWQMIAGALRRVAAL